MDLIEFECDCNLKLLEDTERKFKEERSKFEEERCELLKQIQSADDNKGSPDISQAESLSPPTYSQVVKWTSVKHARKQAEKQAPKASICISTFNRFSTLKDETEAEMDDKISSPPSPPVQAVQKNKNSKPKKDETKTEIDDKISSPRVHLFKQYRKTRTQNQSPIADPKCSS